MTDALFHFGRIVFSTVITVAMASLASAGPLLQLDYNAAKTLGSVHIAGGAIDLTNGAMIVTTSSFGFVPSGGQANEYGSPGVAEFGDAAIHDALAEGANYFNGAWNGTNGIISSTAANDPDGNKAVGWIDNSIGAFSTFRGISVGPGQSVIAYTYAGDSGLYGETNFADYLQVANSYGQPFGSYIYGGGAEWIDGNTDQSGTVDFSDYLAVANTYGLPPLFTQAPIVPSSAQAVPEPTSFVLSAVVTACGLAFRLLRRSRT